MGGLPCPLHEGSHEGPLLRVVQLSCIARLFTREVCKPGAILVQGRGRVRRALLVHAPSVLVRSSCKAQASPLRSQGAPLARWGVRGPRPRARAPSSCKAHPRERRAAPVRAARGGCARRGPSCEACPRARPSCKALVRGVSSCAGMMIRPRTEGLDVTFNVTQSQTWRHYVRALHQFLEREYTGRGLGGVGRHWGKLGRSWKGTWGVLGGDQRVLGQTEGALEWAGLYWEGPSPYWEALGGP